MSERNGIIGSVNKGRIAIHFNFDSTIKTDHIALQTAKSGYGPYEDKNEAKAAVLALAKRREIEADEKIWFDQNIDLLAWLPDGIVKRVEVDPDFYEFTTSSGARSREFCNEEHGFLSLDRMRISEAEADRIRLAIVALGLPKDLATAKARRTGLDPAKNEFTSGVEVQGDKARIIAPCGRALPWVNSKSALRHSINSIPGVFLKGGQAEKNHILQQVDEVTVLPEGTQTENQPVDDFGIFPGFPDDLLEGVFILDPKDPMVQFMNLLVSGVEPDEAMRRSGFKRIIHGEDEKTE